MIVLKDQSPAASIIRLSLNALSFALHFFLSLMRPIAVALHIKNFSLINESIDDGVGNGVVSKDLVELPERDIGGRYGPQLSIVSRADHLEEQIASLSVQRNVSQLINN